MRVWVAVFVVLSLVCSGGFGIEDMVSGSGPGFRLLLLLVIPLGLGSAAGAGLLRTRFGAARGGRPYRWSRRANGEFMGFQTGWWWTLSIFVDSAVYIALTATTCRTGSASAGGCAGASRPRSSRCSPRSTSAASDWRPRCWSCCSCWCSSRSPPGGDRSGQRRHDPFNPDPAPRELALGGVGVALAWASGCTRGSSHSPPWPARSRSRRKSSPGR